MVKEEKLKRSDVNLSNLSRDKRFENLTGKRFGNLVILGPYKKEKSKLKWVAECDCGNIIKTSRCKLVVRGKTSCVECSETKLRDKIFTPIQDKIHNLLSERSDIEIVEREGDTWADYWTVKCKNCNNQYSRRYRDLIKGVKGCECKNLDRKGLSEKVNTVETYCKDNGFEFLGWDTSNKIKVKIRCIKHNKHYLPDYHNISQGKNCCKFCVKESRIYYNQKDTESFIRDAKLVHGNSFKYHEVNYQNSGTKVKIFCNSCNQFFYQTPAGHLSGRKCNKCKVTGYKAEEKCYLYVMQLEGMGELYYKIGITNSIKTRLYNLSRGSWFEIQPLKLYLLDKGWKAFDIEKQVINKFKCSVVDKKYQPEGYSETFRESDIDAVLNFVDHEIQKYY